MSNRSPLLALACGVSLLAGCVAQPAATPSTTPTPAPSSMATAAPSVEPSGSPAPSPTPAEIAVPFQAGTGTRLGLNEIIAPGYAGFDEQQGFIYVAEALDAKLATPGYQLVKFGANGNAITRNSLALTGAKAPTRVDGLVVNLSGFPVVNTFVDNQFQLVKVAGATTVAADRYPVNSLLYARMGASASAENGKFVTVGVIHRASDSANSGPEYLSVGRGEEDKAPTVLYRVQDPLAPSSRMTVARDGQAYLTGSTSDGRLSVVHVRADGTTEFLPIALSAIPDLMTVQPDGRLCMAWSGGISPAKARTVDASGAMSPEVELKLPTGDYLTQLYSVAIANDGRAVFTGAGFDATGKSIKAVFVFNR